MTNNVRADEINTQKHVRFWVQPGGPGPANKVYYSGQDNTYMNIESGENPVRGDISPRNVHDPRVAGRYRQVGREISAPDLPSWSVMFYQKKDVLPRHLVELQNCYVNFYMLVGDCKDLSDFMNGWSSYVKIYSLGQMTTQTEAGGSFDGDDVLTDELPFTGAAILNVGALGFGKEATAEVFSEIVDITYGSRVQCGACGPADDGTKLIYALMKNTTASPGTAPSIVYSVNGQNGPWTATIITGAAAGDVPMSIDVVGQNLMVTFDNGTTGGYFYAEINRITGRPGTFTKVTTGFVTAKAPQDVFVQSAREIWFCGKGGYIYKSENIQAGVSVVDAGDTVTDKLQRIHGVDEVLVTTGENGNVVYSLNRGQSWQTVTVAPAALNIDALWVVDDYTWFVGDDSGDVFYTRSQGQDTWVDLGMPDAATAIQDIVFATPEVGYIAYTLSGPTAVIRATYDGGYSWTTTSPRILNLPVFDRANRLAVPIVPNLNYAANNLAVGALAGNGTDGLILVATAATL